MATTNIDNQLKTISGKNAKILIDEMLRSMQRDLNIDMVVTTNYSTGYPNKHKQFKMDFQLSFPSINDEKWLVKSTNSIRERIYGTEFFAQNIRMINKSITNIFVVVPDSIPYSEKRNKENYADKIKSLDYVSFLTDVITVSELRKKILDVYSKNIDQGVRSNILGMDAEKEVMKLLNNEINRRLWNNYEANRHIEKSSTFDMYKEILIASGFVFGTDVIDNILATDNIPLLSNRGKPKTDISFLVTINDIIIRKNISVKNSSAKVVSVHEGSVEDLICALQLQENSILEQALKKFEELGSEKHLRENYPQFNSALNSNLEIYNKRLVDFFIFGEGNPLVNNPSMQIVDLILYTTNHGVWNRNTYSEKYIFEYASKGQFGTPFKWTYPSKKRGKKIQIKAFTNNK